MASANQTTTPKVQISKAFIAGKLENGGMTKEEIRATYYSQINPNQWTKALKAMGLSSVRAKKVDFVIVDENVAPEACATCETATVTEEATA